MKNLIFIPARGGSKRLPKKNILDFCGKPLICHSIEYAKLHAPSSEICVSTDDKEISRIASEYGVTIMERPDALAGDSVKTVDVALNVIEQYAENGARFDNIVTLQPTCPLRPAGLLNECLEILDREQGTSVITLSKNEHKQGRFSNNIFYPHYAVGIRSQDMVPTYNENGLLYVTRVSVVLETKKFIWGKAFGCGSG